MCSGGNGNDAVVHNELRFAEREDYSAFVAQMMFARLRAYNVVRHGEADVRLFDMVLGQLPRVEP